MKRGIIFAESLHNDVLLHVPNRHVIFTIPKMLRCYFRYDRNINSLLFTAAWEAIKQLYADALPNGNPGCVMALGFLDSNALRKLFEHKLMHALKHKGLITDTIIAQIRSWNTSGFSV